MLICALGWHLPCGAESRLAGHLYVSKTKGVFLSHCRVRESWPTAAGTLVLEVLNLGNSRASMPWQKLLGQLGKLHIKHPGAAFLDDLLWHLWERLQMNACLVKRSSQKSFLWSIEWKLELFWWEHVTLGQKKGGGSKAKEIRCNNYLTKPLICRCHQPDAYASSFPLLGAASPLQGSSWSQRSTAFSAPASGREPFQWLLCPISWLWEYSVKTICLLWCSPIQIPLL